MIDGEEPRHCHKQKTETKQSPIHDIVKAAPVRLKGRGVSKEKLMLVDNCNHERARFTPRIALQQIKRKKESHTVSKRKIEQGYRKDKRMN